MNDRLRLAFEAQSITLPLARICPLRKVDAAAQRSAIYKRVAASVREVGIIEPLIVFPQDRGKHYLLLDGHVRLQVLKDMGQTETLCLVATEDEAYTYNHKVNQVPPIQEHFMILKAIQNGVSEERIAKALNVDVAQIRRKRDLLKGICPEAVDLLKNKRISPGALREMRKVKPIRQIEMAELMLSAGSFSSSYARCLYAATPQTQLVEPDKEKVVRGCKPEDLSRMEREMESLGRDFKLIEESHGRNVLNLVLSMGYLRKLLDNAAAVRFLSQHYRDILDEFQKMLESASLEASR